MLHCYKYRRLKPTLLQSRPRLCFNLIGTTIILKITNFIMNKKLYRIVKKVFIIFLLVRALINYPLTLSPTQVVFVFTLLLPSVRRFLAEEVLVMVSTEPQARDGQVTVEPLSPPSVTFCPSQEIL